MPDPAQLPAIKARLIALIGLPWRWSRDARPRRYLIEGHLTRVGVVETEQEADFIVHAPADIDWLVGEVKRLQRFEAMFEDCARHRDQAEQRARRYMEIVRQVAELVAPDEEEV